MKENIKPFFPIYIHPFMFMFVFKYTNGLLPDSFDNIFNKLGNFDKSLNYKIDLLNFSSFQTFPSYTLLKIWNNLPSEIERHL